MPLPVIADTARVTLNFFDSETVTTGHCVQHFHCPAGTELDLATALDDALSADCFSAMANNSSLVSYDILQLDGATAGVEVASTAGLSGGGGSSPIPAAAGVVSTHTLLRGPAHRGRMFLPFMGEEQTEAGRISDASVTAMQAAWEDFRTAMDTAGFHWVVASYTLADETAVNSITVKAFLGTQRRRQDALR